MNIYSLFSESLLLSSPITLLLRLYVSEMDTISSSHFFPNTVDIGWHSLYIILEEDIDMVASCNVKVYFTFLCSCTQFLKQDESTR
jgi:hypothetical protein